MVVIIFKTIFGRIAYNTSLDLILKTLAMDKSAVQSVNIMSKLRKISNPQTQPLQPQPPRGIIERVMPAAVWLAGPSGRIADKTKLLN